MNGIALKRPKLAPRPVEKTNLAGEANTEKHDPCAE